jgi:hypothetical protein
MVRDTGRGGGGEGNGLGRISGLGDLSIRKLRLSVSKKDQ